MACLAIGCGIGAFYASSPVPAFEMATRIFTIVNAFHVMLSAIDGFKKSPKITTFLFLFFPV
jgi:hypothetical protein